MPENDLAAEIASGDMLTTIELARQHNTHPSTIFRWLQRGLPDGRGGRVFLEAVRRGKSWFTSKAAVARFFSRLPQSQATPIVPIRPPAARERETARAKTALDDRYGI